MKIAGISRYRKRGAWSAGILIYATRCVYVYIIQSNHRSLKINTSLNNGPGELWPIRRSSFRYRMTGMCM